MSSNKKSTALNYTESSWAVLAGIRFLLASIVFLSHLLLWFIKPSPMLAALFALGGKASVLGFFLISGTSIGHSYLQQPNGYYTRRFLRIYPLYSVAVCLSLYLIFTLGPHYKLPGITIVASHWKTNVANFLLLQGFAAVTIAYNPPLWTISIEVFYYVLAPLLSRIWTLALILVIIISLFLFTFFPESWLFGYQALRWMWPWLIGFIFAIRGQSKEVLMLLVLGVVSVFLNKTDTAEIFSWANFLAVAAIVYFASHFSLPIYTRNILNYLGELSYPLYLFHAPVCCVLFHFLGIRSTWLFVTLTLV